MSATHTMPTPLPLRNDTILGVCEAIGEDFGFNPLWLRLVFIAPLFVEPVLTVAVYLALGVIVAASRYFAPRVVVSEPAAAKLAQSDAQVEERLPIAA